MRCLNCLPEEYRSFFILWNQIIKLHTLYLVYRISEI